MDLVNIFRKPDYEISNMNVIREMMGKPTSFFSMFVAGAKIVDGKIELEKESVVCEYIQYIVEKDRVYSEYAITMCNVLKGLFVESKNPEYPSLVMGFYDKKNDDFIIEGFVKDFYKINSIDIIDYYFTLKHQDVYYSREFLEKEYFSIVQKVVAEDLFEDRATYQDFAYFFENVSGFLANDPMNNFSHYELNDNITTLLKSCFPRLTNHVEQKKLSFFFDAIGLFSLRLLEESGEILINPKREKVNLNKRYKEVFTISSRAKKIWNLK